MYCRNCGNQLDDKAVACTRCGVDPRNGRAFCQACGQPTPAAAAICPACAAPLAPPPIVTLRGSDKRVPAGICGILLGALGVHKFILGYTTPGLIMLGVSLVTCGWGAVISGIIGLIEGIVYLTRSDEEFVQTYVRNEKWWF